MKIHSLCRILLLGLVGHGYVQAQTLPIGYTGTSPIAFAVDANGLLSDVGTYTTGSLSLSGAGTRMLWYPGKAAFRAGRVTGTDWDDANIGHYSVGFGIDSAASGDYSVAFGRMNTSSGDYSNTFGYDNFALSTYASAFGHSTSAGGFYTTSFGYMTSAYAEADTVVGRFNTYASGTLNPGGLTISNTTWQTSDPLFEVGNGTTTSNLSDAMVVYKDGSATMQGPVTVTNGAFTTAAGIASTDIPMYGH